MALYDDYLAVLNEQRCLYGPKTLVLYQVGTFWEMLDCDQHLGCDVPLVASILNIQVTRRNKSILEVSRSNNCLAGFNVVSLSKYLPLLVSSLFTVVIVSEVCNSPMIRKITQIVSKGTWIEDPSPSVRGINKRIACLYLQYSTILVGCGFASLDLRTGNCDAFEVGSVDASDVNAVFDKICTICATIDITELMITGDVCKEQISRLRVCGIVHDLSGNVNTFHKPLIQELVLRKAYPKTGFLSAAEFVGLERSAMALTAFVTLIDFTHKHDETIVANLPVPSLGDAASDRVSLSATTLRDLDITSDETNTGLASMLNGCLTGMGQRLFRERLTHPISDVVQLQNRFDDIDVMRCSCLCDEVRDVLRGIQDIERCWRRLVSRGNPKTISADVLTIRSSLVLIKKALIMTGRDGCANVDSVLLGLSKVDEDGQICAGVFEDVDEARRSVASYTHAKDAWMASVTGRLGQAKAHLVKFSLIDDPCAHATCTVKRFVEVKSLLGLDMATVLDETPARIRFSGSYLRHSAADSAVARLGLELVVAQRWRQLSGKWCEDHCVEMGVIVSSIAVIDLHACIASDSIKHDLVRPTVVSGPTSSVECMGVRHPLAERIHQSTPYVPNDLSLDAGGVLLYGVNASGKSTLGKALALAVVMAQAGMFVACRSIRLVPFSKVLTRMASRDDIYHGRSTFMVELMELRDILHRTDCNTLVVGDELCSGTESASAISIVGAVCLHLVQMQSCFFLATHLHELSRMPETGSNPRIQIVHLGVTFEPGLDELIYDRKILEGPGKALYGLEVARSMHMPPAFMQKAHQIRREILGVDHDVVRTKSSHFNRSVFVDVCGVCGARAEETHHIVPQALADTRGIILPCSGLAAFHMNARHNLVALCRKCHDDVHSQRSAIHGYVWTSDGARLSSST